MQKTDFLIELRRASESRDAEMLAQAPPGTKFSPSFRGNELAGEVGEACNILKKLDREQMGVVGSRAKVEQLVEELADVIICVDLIGMDYGIDLINAVRLKFNKTSVERNLKTRL